MNTHKKINEILVGFALGELSEQQESDVKTHLAECRQCSDELKRLEALLECTAQMKELSADNQMCESAKQAIFATIASKEKEPTATASIDLASVWRTIMKSRITKVAAAAVVIIAVMLGLHYYAGPIGVTSVAWAELVERVERSHDEYMKKLLSAAEEKDTEKIEFYADLLSEFWQNLGWLAETELHPERRDRIFADIAIAKAHYDESEESDKAGIRLFLEYEEQFSDWLGNIKDVDVAWINETVHVCKQMEEYAEEIRDVGRDSWLGFSYAEHCLPSFVTYCEWFERLPWGNPKQYMTPAILLTGIQRDLTIARRELEALEIRGVIRFVKRCVEQTRKNVLDLDKKTASSRTKKQRDLCRHLIRRIDELCALITYAEIASQDLLEQIINQNQYKRGERYDQVLTEEFGNKGPFADYYIERIDQSLDLCEQLLEGLESEQ